MGIGKVSSEIGLQDDLREESKIYKLDSGIMWRRAKPVIGIELLHFY